MSQQPGLVEAGGEVAVTCNATTEGIALSISWTDKGGNPLNFEYSVNGGVSVLTVPYADVVELKVVVCKAEFKVDGKEKSKVSVYNYTVLAAGEFCDNTLENVDK